MRFRMKFEGEESPEQRFTGTITGISGIDTDRWQDSEWKRFKVSWDENSSITRPERVSHWNVEPASTLPINPVPISRPKRPRTNVRAASPDSSLLTHEVVHKGKRLKSCSQPSLHVQGRNNCYIIYNNVG